MAFSPLAFCFGIFQPALGAFDSLVTRDGTVLVVDDEETR
jgi:hypothetical protein